MEEWNNSIALSQAALAEFPIGTKVTLHYLTDMRGTVTYHLPILPLLDAEVKVLWDNGTLSPPIRVSELVKI